MVFHVFPAEPGASGEAAPLPSLDRVRQELRAPVRPRFRVWTLVVCALFAAIMGVSAAAVTILGPGGWPTPAHRMKMISR
jgi:hypothetical protein